jgi:hypothetical protein
MIMLKRLTWCPYWTMYSMDSPQRGASDNKYINVMEACTILDSFEILYDEAVMSLNRQGVRDFDFRTAEKVLKPCFQQLRHGLAFDWVINSCVSIVAEYYPFTYHKEFSGTQKFIDLFANDLVFSAEVDSVQRKVYEILEWVFEDYPDKSVYKRMSAHAKTINLEQAYEYTITNPPAEPFVIPFITSIRVNYAILFMEMLTIGVGAFKRQIWTSRIEAIKDSAPSHEDLVAVVGSKFRIFVYGDLFDEGKVAWHILNEGIEVNPFNTRVDRPDVARIIPDYMTFFEFTENKLVIDESKVPMVQFTYNDGTMSEWTDPRAFTTMEGFILDQPMIVKIRYDFPQDPKNPKVIGVKGSISTIIKDSLITLDKNGIGTTQVVFRANSISFKVFDPDDLYPFTFFSSSLIKYSDNFDWLK